jgi:hypothetical protein
MMPDPPGGAGHGGADRCLVCGTVRANGQEPTMSERSEQTTDAAEPFAGGGRMDSAADAEDVLQETWLRWAGVDLRAAGTPATR